MRQDEILNKMRSGSMLTLGSLNSAHLDKYTKNQIEVDYSQAKRCTFLSVVDCWGGNLDTGDRHFTYKGRDTHDSHTPRSPIKG